jgi:hydrogenase nickel incorporation protein HypB
MVNLETGQTLAPGPASHDHHHHQGANGDGHSHSHAHGHQHHGHHHHDHAHPHAHRHDHDHHHHDETGHSHGRVDLEARILAKNDAQAARNRAWLSGREILALNLISSPGSGKTSLLERTIRDLCPDVPISVIEGDQATAKDGERIRAAGAPAIQINTGAGCHLEAEMISRALQDLRPTANSLLFIENVGNLVCPAMFDLGERAKVVILSVTEGEDKPLKYPHIFQAAELMIVNKTDLLPHVDFDLALAASHARDVNPRIQVLPLSARTGDGLPEWYGWLRREQKAAGTPALG